MTGKSEHIVSYTAEELAAKRDAGEGRTDHQLDAETARQRRTADPQAPLPYEGWQDTIRTDLPKPKQQVTLRIDADVLTWFRGQGKGYQTLMNAVLKGYADHRRDHRE